MTTKINLTTKIAASYEGSTQCFESAIVEDICGLPEGISPPFYKITLKLKGGHSMVFPMAIKYDDIYEAVCPPGWENEWLLISKGEAMNQYKPDTVTHPGETIKDLLTTSKCSFAWFYQNFASLSGGRYNEQFSEQFAAGLLNGNSEITSEVAKILELMFYAPAAFWLERESQYRQHLDKIS
jgi:hypothetical protein